MRSRFIIKKVGARDPVRHNPLLHISAYCKGGKFRLGSSFSLAKDQHLCGDIASIKLIDDLSENLT